eukprot:732317-Hanusia_phi.AAC.1
MRQRHVHPSSSLRLSMIREPSAAALSPDVSTLRSLQKSRPGSGSGQEQAESRPPVLFSLPPSPPSLLSLSRSLSSFHPHSPAPSSPPSFTSLPPSQPVTASPLQQRDFGGQEQKLFMATQM